MPRVTRSHQSLSPALPVEAPSPAVAKAVADSPERVTRAMLRGMEQGAKAQEQVDKESKKISKPAAALSLAAQAPTVYFGFSLLSEGMTWMSVGASEIASAVFKQSILENPMTKYLLGIAFSAAVTKFAVSKLRQSLGSQVDPSSWSNRALNILEWGSVTSVAAMVQVFPLIKSLPSTMSFEMPHGFLDGASKLLSLFDIANQDVYRSFDKQMEIATGVNNFVIGALITTAVLGVDWAYQRYLASPKAVQNIFNRFIKAG